MNDPVCDILQRLEGVKRAGSGHSARCPAHDDRRASLSVAKGADGRALLHCHAGCSPIEICQAMGLRLSALFPPKSAQKRGATIVATYDYRDADGNLLFQTVRLDPKDFRQRRPDGNGGWVWNLNATPRVLYRLPELVSAEPGEWIFIVEGEKDADSVAALGLVATTCPTGAGKWHKLSDDSVLDSRRIAIIPDADETGRRHARTVAALLHGRAGDIRIVRLPGSGKDVSDWIAGGGTADQLLALVEAAPLYEPTVQASPNDEVQEVPSLPAHRFKLDLYGNADRFCHLFGRNVHWFEQRGRWLVWNGRVWNPDATREVSRLAELTVRAMFKEAAEANDDETIKWAVRCNKSAQARKEMLDVVKHRTAVRADEFDRKVWLLGVSNGVVDLKTGRLLPHSRDHMITALCPTIYDPHALRPRWDSFLGEIMGSNAAMIAALQRMAGYFLTGDISVQILPIFYGPGGNGKNVYLDTLTGLMGPYAAEAPDGLVTARAHDEHPTEIADLCGKRLVIASETEEGKKMRVGLVKKLTGNKYLKARFMRQDYFQFERTHKTVLVTNNKPVVTETSNAIWRRLRLIPFEVTIPEDRQDRHLTDKLMLEWPGILAWAVEGCLDWQRRKCDLALPEAIKQATQSYRDESDHVADFLTERCVRWPQSQEMKAPKERVYTTYVSWCKDIGEEVLTRTAFNRRMRGQGLVDSTVRIGDKTVKCWKDVTLGGKSDV